MVLASQLRNGMAIIFEGQKFKVLSSTYHPGQGKMSGQTHVRLQHLATHAFRETSLRGELKVETLPVEKRNLQYLYADEDQCYFMDPENYEQIAVSVQLIGQAVRFVQPEMIVPVEFIEGEPISVQLPEVMEFKVLETAPPAHQQQDSTWKSARLEQEVEINVPQFIKVGDIVRVDIASLRYVDRARGGKS